MVDHAEHNVQQIEHQSPIEVGAQYWSSEYKKLYDHRCGVERMLHV